MSTSDSPGSALLAAWRRWSDVPGGRRLFSWYVGRMAPYTGTMGAVVRSLEPGHAVVELRDRRRIRNHLRSVHAVALANLGELTTGLALTTALPPSVRGIPVRLEIDFLKKARGRLTAECQTTMPPITSETEHDVVAQVHDSAGDLVARVRVRWRVGPVRAT